MGILTKTSIFVFLIGTCSEPTGILFLFLIGTAKSSCFFFVRHVLGLGKRWKDDKKKREGPVKRAMKMDITYITAIGEGGVMHLGVGRHEWYELRIEAAHPP